MHQIAGIVEVCDLEAKLIDKDWQDARNTAMTPLHKAGKPACFKSWIVEKVQRRITRAECRKTQQQKKTVWRAGYG